MIKKEEFSKSVSEYINEFPANVKKRLQQVRKTIKEAAPEAMEMISYGIIGYMYMGRLIYVGGYKNHIGLYPVTAGMKVHEKQLTQYRKSKGTLQFKHDAPIPFGLITKLVKIRVRENKTALKEKQKKKTAS